MLIFYFSFTLFITTTALLDPKGIFILFGRVFSTQFRMKRTNFQSPNIFVLRISCFNFSQVHAVFYSCVPLSTYPSYWTYCKDSHNQLLLYPRFKNYYTSSQMTSIFLFFLSYLHMFLIFHAFYTENLSTT